MSNGFSTDDKYTGNWQLVACRFHWTRDVSNPELEVGGSGLQSSRLQGSEFGSAGLQPSRLQSLGLALFCYGIFKTLKP
jgi:hypothetical protein